MRARIDGRGVVYISTPAFFLFFAIRPLATTLTRWNSGGEQYVLYVRPLLPDEAGNAAGRLREGNVDVVTLPDPVARPGRASPPFRVSGSPAGA